MLLFAIVAISLIWMHISTALSGRDLHPHLQGPKTLPEILPLAEKINFIFNKNKKAMLFSISMAF